MTNGVNCPQQKLTSLPIDVKINYQIVARLSFLVSLNSASMVNPFVHPDMYSLLLSVAHENMRIDCPSKRNNWRKVYYLFPRIHRKSS